MERYPSNLSQPLAPDSGGGGLHLQQKITSLRELAPFFTCLSSLSSPDCSNTALLGAHQFSSHSDTAIGSDEAVQINRVENELLRDFLEPYF